LAQPRAASALDWTACDSAFACFASALALSVSLAALSAFFFA
jgi:hypothetical protein